jgi:DNA-binding IclR family transcriptional regulator
VELPADYPVKSGARAVQILEFFRDRRSPARAIDVGRHLALSPSSANDLLKTLADIGYLEFDEKSKFYFIGARAAMFGHWAAGVSPSVGKLEDFAKELGRRTGECVALSTYCKGAMLLLMLVRRPDVALPGHLRVGVNLPVAETAAGGAILMDMEPADLLRVVKRTYHMKKIGKAARELLRKIDGFRKQGYAASLNENLLPGLQTFALLLPCKISYQPIVASICGPESRIKRREQELVAIARGLIANSFGDHIRDGQYDLQPWDSVAVRVSLASP